MISRSTTNRMKAAAVAAVMCLSATAFAMPSYVNLSAINPITVSAAGDTLAAGDSYKGFTADIAKSGIKTVNITLTADYTGNFSYGFGISTADSPYWYEWDGKTWVDTKGGKVEVPGISVPVTAGKEFTITIDTSALDLKYADEWDSKYDGTFEFRNYYSGEADGKVTVKSVSANGSSTPTTPDTTEPSEPDASEPDTTNPGTTTSTKLAAKDVYEGFTADLAKSGIKNITITVTPDYTGGFTCGFGIGTADSPYWYEWDGKAWVDTKGGKVEVPGVEYAATEGEDIVIVIDTSKLSLSYNPKTDDYPGKFEFRNYYSGEDDGSVTIKSIVANGTTPGTTPGQSEEPTEDEHALAKKDGQTANLTSGTATVDNNGDGTVTFRATQARQIEFETPLTLTQGYDEEYYAAEGTSPVEGKDPLNSHKFAYSDFGLTGVGDTVSIESIMATIKSEQSVKNFMYGGGLNVQNQSPADTEAAKAAKGVATTKDAGYWYNDMGEEKIEELQAAGVEFGIEPGYGYFLSSEDNQLGGYFNVFWDVPEEVKPYVTPGEISFQYWYGVEDTEEYTEIDTVDLMGGILTYTETQTFECAGTKKVDVNRTIDAGDMSGEISFMEDLELEAGQDVHAVVFTVSADSDLDKLVYGIGASVGEDWQMWSPEDAEWDFVVTNTKSGDIEIAWIVPATLDINEEYGNLQFGYWYGGKGETELDSVTLKSVEVFYSQSEEPMEESTEPEPELTVTLWGDADCNDEVDILDAILVNKALMGKATLTEQGKLNADINQSGAPDSTDSLNILKLIVDLISQKDCPIV